MKRRTKNISWCVGIFCSFLSSLSIPLSLTHSFSLSLALSYTHSFSLFCVPSKLDLDVHISFHNGVVNEFESTLSSPRTINNICLFFSTCLFASWQIHFCSAIIDLILKFHIWRCGNSKQGFWLWHESHITLFGFVRIGFILRSKYTREVCLLPLPCSCFL